MRLLKEHRGFFCVIVVAGTLFISDIWAWKHFVRAESYFGLGARLMVEQGDWLAPHAPDEQVLNKPPLTYWLIGLCYKLFGFNYGAARLPSGIAALGVLAIVYALGIRYYGKMAGLISSAMLASSLLFVGFARLAMSDMLLTLFVTAGIACFAVAFGSQSEKSVWPSIGFAAIALGILTKGPVALVLVGAPVFLDLALSRSLGGIKKLRLGLGLMILIGLAAPYFLLLYFKLGTQPLKFFFLSENLQRFSGQVYGSSGRPFWYEFVAFFADFAPWSLLLPIAMAAGYLAWKRGTPTNRITRICWLWLGSTLVLFSLSSFKLDYYLLPAMPAAALIVGGMVANSEAPGRLGKILIKGFLLVCCAFILVAAFFSLKAAGEIQATSALRFLPLVISISGTILILIWVTKNRVQAGTLALAALMVVTLLSIELALLPTFVQYLPARELAASVPKDRMWYTTHGTNDWANDIAFNLSEQRVVTRSPEAVGPPSVRLRIQQEQLTQAASQPRAAVLMLENDYEWLRMRDPALKILAQAETYGQSGVTIGILRHPKRERLLVVGR